MLKLKQNPFKYLFIFLAGLFFILLCAQVARIKSENKREHKAFIEATAGTESFFRKSKNFSIYFEIPDRNQNSTSPKAKNSWFDKELNEWGAQYDIYIENTSQAVLTDWKLKIILPSSFRIDSFWNVEKDLQEVHSPLENSITVCGIENALNTKISNSAPGKIGFVLYTPQIIENCSFELSYRLNLPVLKSQQVIIFLVCLILSIVVLFVYSLFDIMLKRQKKQSFATIQALIRLISHFIDVRDPYTKEHSSHVAKYSKMIAEKMGFSEEELQNIYCMGLLHDVGKVYIPSEILRKPAKLTDDEWQIMKRHTIYGSQVLNEFKDIPNVKEAVLYHHERYDGKGYMEGLKGEEIPLVARIICVADSYDAMATDRAYRKALSKEVILAELEKNKGIQFDPKIAEIMIELIKEGKI